MRENQSGDHVRLNGANVCGQQTNGEGVVRAIGETLILLVILQAPYSRPRHVIAGSWLHDKSFPVVDIRRAAAGHDPAAQQLKSLVFWYQPLGALSVILVCLRPGHRGIGLSVCNGVAQCPSRHCSIPWWQCAIFKMISHNVNGRHRRMRAARFQRHLRLLKCQRLSDSNAQALKINSSTWRGLVEQRDRLRHHNGRECLVVPHASASQLHWARSPGLQVCRLLRAMIHCTLLPAANRLRISHYRVEER